MANDQLIRMAKNASDKPKSNPSGSLNFSNVNTSFYPFDSFDQKMPKRCRILHKFWHTPRIFCHFGTSQWIGGKNYRKPLYLIVKVRKSMVSGFRCSLKHLKPMKFPQPNPETIDFLDFPTH